LNVEMILLLALLLVALVLFSFEWIAVEVVSLTLLLALVVTGLLPVDIAFEGFGSSTVLAMLGLLILTTAMTKTGVADAVGQLIDRGNDEVTRPNRLTLTIMTAVAILSSFMGNTASTAFTVPIVLSISRRAKISASRLLMPLAFAAILASSVTLISTSTNLVVNGLMAGSGMQPMGMFELAPVGLPILIVGLAYMLVFGPALVPETRPAEDLADELGSDLYLADLLVPPGSALAGKTLRDTRLGRDFDLVVLQVVRGAMRDISPTARTELRENDVLLVEGRREQVLKAADLEGLTLEANYKFSDPALDTDEVEMAELLVLPGSPVIGQSLKERRFRDRYGLQVLGIDRHGETIHQKLGDIRLRVGDILLVQGARDKIRAINEAAAFRVLGRIERRHVSRQQRTIAIAIFGTALLLTTFNIVPLAVAMLGGAVLVFVTRCITPEEAYQQVQWKILILIGCMLGVGTAMEVTGTAEFLAHYTVDLLGASNPRWLLTAFFALTVLLTQPMSNQAAAAVVFPVAIQSAAQLGYNPRTFAMMIAVAASTSFLTPLEPACLMVYGPGRYRFLDFVKAGLPLTVVIYLIAILLVPVIWPL
jgi:di/tricarboxylate transporter